MSCCGGQELPPAVAIDEAVELAKGLSTDDSPGFVNGVLGKIAVEPHDRDHQRNRASAQRSTRGAPGGIRTHTVWILSPPTLPVGLQGRARKFTRTRWRTDHAPQPTSAASGTRSRCHNDPEPRRLLRAAFALFTG